MAAPAFGTAGTQVETTSSTMSVDVPDSVAAGDIIVVTAYVAADLGATVTGLAFGFAQAADSPVQVNIGLGGQHRIYVMWKRATGADSTGSTYDFTLSASDFFSAQAIRYTGGISSGDPWDVTNSAESGNTNVSTTPAVSDTTTVADTLLVWTGSNWNGGAWTPPTSFTERRDSGAQICTVADLAQAVAGSTGSISGTCASSNKSGAWLGALKSETAVVDTSVYSIARLPGRIGPDGKIFTPGIRFDNNGAVAEVTGSAAETQDNQTSTASGQLGYSGSVAVTQANQTSTATGVLGYSGTVAETQDNQTSSATGVLGYPGTLAETQDNQTSTASGSVAGGGEVTGTVAETQDNQTSTASGVLGYTGTSARTQANQTATAAGWITITGTVSRTQTNQTATAAGTLGYSGTAARTQDNQTATAAGWINVTGTAARVQDNQIASGSGFIGEFATPETRIHIIPADPRQLTIESDIRTWPIPDEPRTYTVPYP